MVQNREVPSIKIGHLWRIRRKDLEAMIEGDGGKPQHR